ncbi:MAG: hypothetical protein E7532_00535 [Ruminococcaceae bacterium]|nr:hypothetical protein [Oscillospiraceae bacterium]
MKFNKKILIPLVSVLISIVVVFLVIGLTSEKPLSSPVSGTVDEAPALPTTSPAATEAKDTAVTLSFVGDCILGVDPVEYSEGSFIWYSENYPLSYFFEKVYGVLSKDDFTIANMECVLSDNLSLKPIDKGEGPAFWFRAKAKNAGILTEGSVEVASVVNNHVDDFGDEGYTDTVKSLENAGLLVGEDCVPVYFEKNGIKIGLVCCNLWGQWQLGFVEDALEEMADKCDYKIVFFHGGTEGRHMPDNYKIDACRELAESGLCDLIVGAHPHVLQPLEVVDGVPIMYSIGNFCFAGNNYPENKTVIFQATITKDSAGSLTTETNIVPCYVYTGPYNNWQPAVITDPQDKADIMAMVNTPVEYTVETEPTTTAPEESSSAYQEYTEDIIYFPEETEIYTEEFYEPEEDTYYEDVYEDEYENDYEDDYYEEIETVISYY